MGQCGVCSLGWVVTVIRGTVWGMRLRMGRYCDLWDSVAYDGLGWVVTVTSGTVWGMWLRVGRYCDLWDSVGHAACVFLVMGHYSDS